jgi:hypothetical protein
MTGFFVFVWVQVLTTWRYMDRYYAGNALLPDGARIWIADLQSRLFLTGGEFFCSFTVKKDLTIDLKKGPIAQLVRAADS